jgi:hypothetical protein
MRTRSWIGALAVTPLILLGCGSDDDSDEAIDSAASDVTDAPATDPPASASTSTEPATSGPSATDPPATVPPVSEAPPVEPETADASAVSDVAVTMDEWFIEAPTDLTAGEVTFAIQNDGSFPHEFVVIAGEGYDALPLAANGAVLEDELPDGAVIDRTDRIEGGLDGELTVALEPGNYVLLCNIVAGPTSHAGRGQNLDVTVG